MKHMEEYPDEELIDMYRAGNEQAIEYIFERYKYIVRRKQSHVSCRRRQ